MASKVGPLVTSARRPDSRKPARKWAVTALTMSNGSAMRPSPYSPHAMSPSSGPISTTPRAASVVMLSRVAACCHMRTFIDGATRTGLSVASNAVVARSSAMPCAMRAMMLAVAGATSTTSASRESWIWPISCSSVSENRSP